MSPKEAKAFSKWDARARIEIAAKIGDAAAMAAGLYCEPQPDGSARMRLVLDLESVPLDRRAASAATCSETWANWPADGEAPLRTHH